jgi:hypothetical protein
VKKKSHLVQRKHVHEVLFIVRDDGFRKVANDITQLDDMKPAPLLVFTEESPCEAELRKL